MNDSEKLDIILAKLQGQEIVTEEQRLYLLASKYWGLTERDCQNLKLAKQILDNGTNNIGMTLDFVVTMGGIVNRFGAERVLKSFDKK